MLEYDFEIIYKNGNTNVVVDALSKKEKDVEALFYVISIIKPYWIEEVRD